MDPENVWLWRQNRKRLDFEATRDTMLAVSGELDRSLDGPSVKLTSKPFPLRRTVYAYVDRVDLDPMLKVFDFASPLASASVRSETTVPQHALFVMNHPFVIERAKTIAAKVRPAESSRDLVNRGINSLFRRMLGRLPTAQERSAALTFVSLPAYNGSLKRLSPWSYGIIENKGPNANLFVPLPHWTGKVYQGSPNFPDSKYGFGRVTNLGGHPASVTMDFVRRFHVPADGTAKIAGKLSHPTDRGDGVIASIIVSEESSNEPKLLGQWTSFNNEVDTTVERIEVSKGGTIDFIVNSGKSGTSDSFNWTNEIVIDFDGQSSTTWTSKDGFKPPAPPMMDGWEQLAQALMLTNEFIYID